MLRPRLVLALALAAVFLPAPLLAAGGIASLDFQRLLQEAPQTTASRKLLKQEYAPRAVAIEHAKKRVVALGKHLLDLGPGTNPLELANAREQIKQARKKLGELTHQYKLGLQMRRTQLRANFKKLVDEHVKRYAVAHGFSVVLGEDAAYAGPAADITDAILAQLKQEYSEAQASAGGNGG